MKNPLSNLSRPKALGLAGVVAGVLAISGSAAAINVGLLGSGASEPFTPQKVSTESVPSTTETTDAPAPEVVYQDVYEHVAGAPAPSGPAASSEGPNPQSTGPDVEGDDSDDSTDVDMNEVEQDDDQMGEDDHADDSGEHAEDADHEVEYEDDGADD